MRKLKIVVAVLVVLFACQAAFAGFVPVQKADPAVTRPLARFCDILQSKGLAQKNPVAFYMEMAGSSDEAIAAIIADKGAKAYESATTLEQLAQVFPRGVEATDDINAFRRAALHLAIYTANNGHLQSSAKIDAAEASFEIVGYKYLVRLVGKTIKFDFIDIYSEAELRAIADKLASDVPAVGVSFPEYGEIDIETTGITEFGFRQFVAKARSLMYSLIY